MAWNKCNSFKNELDTEGVNLRVHFAYVCHQAGVNQGRFSGEIEECKCNHCKKGMEFVCRFNPDWISEWHRKNPNPSQPEYLYEADRVLVLGDIHGDLFLLLSALFLAGLINLKGEWIGEIMRTKVVLVGDIVDGFRMKEVKNANPHSESAIFQYIEFMNALTNQHIILRVVGNHEEMRMKGNTEYMIGKDELDEGETFWPGELGKDNLKSKRQLKSFQTYIAATMPYVIRIGKCFFSHTIADFEGQYSYKNWGIEHGEGMQHLNKSTFESFRGDYKVPKELHHSLWDRNVGSGDGCEYLQDYAQFLGEKKGDDNVKSHFFIGHSIQKQCSRKGCRYVGKSYCTGKLNAIDVAASLAFHQPDHVTICKIENPNNPNPVICNFRIDGSIESSNFGRLL